MRLSGNYGIGDGGKSTSNDVRSQSEVSVWPFMLKFRTFAFVAYKIELWNRLSKSLMESPISGR